MSSQNKAALIRALILAVVAAGFATVTWMSSKPEYAVPAGIFGAFLTRFVAEGGYDTSRQESGDVRKSDVGAK